MSSFYRGSFF